MLTVKVETVGWLRDAATRRPAAQCSMLVPDGETVLKLARRLACEQPAQWRGVVGDEGEEIGATVIVALNGRLVNPHDAAETALRDGDKVAFLPAFEGG
jgi:molybdopterin converting factor small subunit